MAHIQLHHTVVVVSDLESARTFFTELGLELEGQMPIEGKWADRINAIEGIHCEIAMMRTPDGQGRLELTQYSHPPVITPDPHPAPPNTLGLRSVMFNVEDVDATVTRLQAVGGELIGEVVQYEDIYRLCYMRGPGGIIVALAETLG